MVPSKSIFNVIWESIGRSAPMVNWHNAVWHSLPIPQVVVHVMVGHARETSNPIQAYPIRKKC